MANIRIDPEKCLKDGLCVEICCESHVFIQGADGGVPLVVNEKECTDCGHCVAICPGDAIIHSGMDMSRFVPVEPGALPDPMAVEALLASVRSIRHYRNKPVPDAVMEKLLQAGAKAASEHNSQDREFVVVPDPAKVSALSGQIVEHYGKLLSVMRGPLLSMVSIFNPGLGAYLKRSISDMRRVVNEYAPDNDTIFHGAPGLIVITSSKGNILGKDSALTSQEAIRILAHSMGLGTCVSGYAIGAGSVVQRVLNIPRNRKMQTLFTLGYPKYKFLKTVDRKQPVRR